MLGVVFRFDWLNESWSVTGDLGGSVTSHPPNTSSINSTALAASPIVFTNLFAALSLRP